MNKRKTVGELSQELLQQKFDTRDPIELQREMQQEYINNLFDCIKKDKNNYQGDFYVTVITKKEPLMPNVFRNYFFSRHSCPTPDYDQAVYRIRTDIGQLEFLWCIPDRETCFILLENRGSVINEEQELLQNVINFENGTLYSMAKQLNNETE